MKIIEDVAGLRDTASGWRQKGARIGFVPTMGALHEGHLTLVDRARESCDQVVVSIFVNPLQFAPNEDLDRYPRDLEGDARRLKERGVDVLFFPSPDLIYRSGHQTSVGVEDLTKPLCGAFREDHFVGVTTVVCILFNLVEPHAAFFGLKDYQQFRVIERMTQDLHINVEVIGCPIVREEDGVALSSRNAYLLDDERVRARVLYQALCKTQERVASGCLDSEILLDALRAQIEPSVDRLEYVEIRDSKTLEIVKKIEGKSLCAVAVYLGTTRLIDNMELTP